MLELIDTHAHLADAAFRGHVSEVWARARNANVSAAIVIATSSVNSAEAIELAAQYEGLFASVGVQPNHVAAEPRGGMQRIAELVRHSKVVAVGETGLDQYWDDVPLEQQRECFCQHLRLALEVDLPVIIHMREGKLGDGRESCSQAILECIYQICGRGSALRGVMHSYTGTQRMAESFLEAGLHISFAGMLTYKNAIELKAVAATIPANRLLLETDSPYLTPHPHRGKYPNEPANVIHTARTLSTLRNCRFEEIAEITTSNARSLFRLPKTKNLSQR